MAHGDLIDPAVFENLKLELRRGALTLAVLAALRTEQYGYTLRKLLAEQGLIVDEGTLYPLLRRLESQGLLVSEWREEARRNKRFYRLSDEGTRMLALLRIEWRSLDESLDGILSESPDGSTGAVPAGSPVLSPAAAAGRHRP
jgi:PadR family transcriptional regulator PadR